ncbi:hypothetical protein IX53_01670 [Kosmotoga pacifica]|uniref:HEPN domain-containing protein n=2 Tax=Kosmotoga pacifica TaxID=1330330 RepID=A0A0G2Z9I0_9BACT|nr:hypothetical protein IX53_01670 [Kosmotoga pacifica]
MGFTWDEFLEIAKFLKQLHPSNNNYSDECIVRTIVDRAYYSAFNIARDKAVKKGYQKQGAKDHRKLPIFFRSKRPEIAGALEELRDLRNNCSYEIKWIDSRSILDVEEYVILQAEKVLDELK